MLWCCRYLRTLPYPATLLQATLTLRHNIIPNIAPPEVSRDQPISWVAPLLAPELWPPPAQVMITSDFLHLGTNKLSPTPRGNTAYPHQPPAPDYIAATLCQVKNPLKTLFFVCCCRAWSSVATPASSRLFVCCPDPSELQLTPPTPSPSTVGFSYFSYFWLGTMFIKVFCTNRNISQTMNTTNCPAHWKLRLDSYLSPSTELN